MDGTTYSVPDGGWINREDAYGYVPAAGTELLLRRERIRMGGTALNITVNHGTSPVNERYAYTLLPGADREQTEEYANNPDIEILSMTNGLHAVKDKKSGIIAANAFEAGETLLGMTFITPCSLIINGDMYYVTDPSQTIRTARLGFNKSVKITSEYDVFADENGIVTIDMPIRGKSYNFRLISN